MCNTLILLFSVLLCLFIIHALYRRNQRENIFDNWRENHSKKVILIKYKLEKGV
ncbi:hypothetical protein MHK_003923 [Candidatus Magnetomorum sp. HK-1]|nr:hypothetical protein MHK_003923 [Candidatus Magnetomorum sp. HK-1]